MNKFDERRKEFDREFKHAQKWNIVWSIIVITLALSWMGFLVWVIVMTMRYFGII